MGTRSVSTDGRTQLLAASHGPGMGHVGEGVDLRVCSGQPDGWMPNRNKEILEERTSNYQRPCRKAVGNPTEGRADAPSGACRDLTEKERQTQSVEVTWPSPAHPRPRLCEDVRATSQGRCLGEIVVTVQIVKYPHRQEDVARTQNSIRQQRTETARLAGTLMKCLQSTQTRRNSQGTVRLQPKGHRKSENLGSPIL